MSEIINPCLDRPTTVNGNKGDVAALLSSRPALAKSLCKAVLACRSAEKDRRNEFHKYDYASSESILEEGRNALANAGVALIPVESSLVGWERSAGNERFELVRTFLLLDSSGECVPIRVTWPVVPDKGRPLDKATAAADTLSLAYLLRDLLQMPRVDPSDEVAARDDRQHQPQQQQAAWPQQTKPSQQQAAPVKNHLDTIAKLNTFLARLELCPEGEFAAAVVREIPGYQLADLPKIDSATAIAAAHGLAKKLFYEEINVNLQRTDGMLTEALTAAGMNPALTLVKMDWRQLEKLLVTLRNTEGAGAPAA